MPSEKGSLLDKIKAFFVRRKKNKLKKKEQDRKDLEEILKRISTKVTGYGEVVRVGTYTNKIDLSKVSLKNSNKTLQIIKNVKKENNIIINTKEEEKIDSFEGLDKKELEELKEKIISKGFDIYMTPKEIKQDIKKDIIIKDKNSYNFKLKRNLNDKEKEVSVILIRMIDRNLNELAYFRNELNYLSEKNSIAKTEKELEEIEQRFLILKEKLEVLYKEFLNGIEQKNILELNNDTYNEELVEVISKYKLDIENYDNINQILDDINEEYKTNINIIMNIVNLERKEEILTLDSVEENRNIVTNNSELTIDSDILNKISFMKKEIDSNIEKNGVIIDDVNKKISNIQGIEQIKYKFNILDKLCSSTFNFTFGMAMLNPKKGILANTLGSIFMLNSIRYLRTILTPTKEITYIASNNFENEIISHLNDFSYINKNIDLSIEEIKTVKSNLIDQYSNYIDNIEVKNVFIEINKIEEHLKDIKTILLLQEKSLEYSREANNQLIKKIEDNN